jgi:hypothetical protein
MGHAQTVGGQFHKRFPECSVLTVVLKNPQSTEPETTGRFRSAMDEAGVLDIGDFIMLRDEDFRDLEIPVWTQTETTMVAAEP